MSGIGPISETPPAPDIVIGNDPRTITTTSTLGANYAILNAFSVTRAVTVSTAYFFVQTQSGNIDFGIYDGDGNRLASTGSTACPVAGKASIALTAPVTLVPGQVYYLAYAVNNAVASIQKANLMTMNLPPMLGGTRYPMVQAATSFPLPAAIAMPGTATAHYVGLSFG